ncbi:hypothetical protein PRZ48_011468 [Zasmidium cellare]|uniref:Heterokaryon incompatibility domain-containing protein n=1 Tax=Zasmidium cellare TaxID=395010 RepID=A0ABR0E6H3_ZASCE|nr:hypothetical protein PRZ48_011468 [Zasmidium cellare]
MSSFYHPLEQNKIRLLTFVDDTGASCTLEQVSLADAPTYACLSYAWQDGDTADTTAPQRHVAINSEPKPVRQNLHEALSHLAPIARSAGQKFWVDAICINQDDLDERAEQVKLMKHIYEQAATVMAWLGPVTANTELALGMMRSVSNFTHQHFNRHAQSTALHLWQAAISRQPFFENRPKNDVLTGWSEMVQMFKRAFWGRTWVHQEITGNNAMFYCGPWPFTWKELYAFNDFHGTYGGLRDMPEKYLLMISDGVDVGSPFFDLRVAQKNRTKSSTTLAKKQKLMALIRELRLTHCSDARDKVFAALPHATDVGNDRKADLLTVDYSRSVQETYIGVARHYLERDDLEILGYVGANCPDTECRPRRNTDESPLPSWVPDWRIPTRIRPLNSGGRTHRDYPSLYDPLPNTDSRLQITSSSLQIHAIIFDTLRTITPSPGREYESSQLKIKWSRLMKAWTPTLKDRDIKRILNADVQWTADEVSNTRGEVVDWELMDQPVEKMRPEHRDWRHNMRHFLRTVCRDRRAGRTKAGRIGIFPEAAVPGDLVAAFYGGHALYVVRPVHGREGTYNFLGECYIDGMMDGQLLDFVEKEGLNATMLTLI